MSEGKPTTHNHFKTTKTLFRMFGIGRFVLSGPEGQLRDFGTAASRNTWDADWPIRWRPDHLVLYRYCRVLWHIAVSPTGADRLETRGLFTITRFLNFWWFVAYVISTDRQNRRTTRRSRHNCLDTWPNSRVDLTMVKNGSCTETADEFAEPVCLHEIYLLLIQPFQKLHHIYIIHNAQVLVLNFPLAYLQNRILFVPITESGRRMPWIEILY